MRNELISKGNSISESYLLDNEDNGSNLLRLK